MFLLLILAVFAFLIYGIYRAIRRAGFGVLWFVASAVTFLDVAGLVAERLWGPAWSWNFSHHTWSSLPASIASAIFYLAMGFWCCRQFPDFGARKPGNTNPR